MEHDRTIHPLRAWRRENSKTLAEIAAFTGVQPSHLSEIERGLNRPSAELAARLAAATGLSIRVLRPDLAALFDEPAK